MQTKSVTQLISTIARYVHGTMARQREKDNVWGGKGQGKLWGKNIWIGTLKLGRSSADGRGKVPRQIWKFPRTCMKLLVSYLWSLRVVSNLFSGSQSVVYECLMQSMKWKLFS